MDFFILPFPCSFNENPFLARALLAENSIWNPFKRLTLLEPTPGPSSEFLLIAIWLFLVSPRVCWVQQGKSVLLRTWGCVSCRPLIWKCFDTSFVRAPVLETCENKQELGVSFWFCFVFFFFFLSQCFQRIESPVATAA